MRVYNSSRFSLDKLDSTGKIDPVATFSKRLEIWILVSYHKFS